MAAAAGEVDTGHTQTPQRYSLALFLLLTNSLSSTPHYCPELLFRLVKKVRTESREASPALLQVCGSVDVYLPLLVWPRAAAGSGEVRGLRRRMHQQQTDWARPLLGDLAASISAISAPDSSS